MRVLLGRSFWRGLIALGVCGFVIGAAPGELDSRAAHAALPRAERLLETIDDASLELAKGKPPCASKASGSGKHECYAKGALHDTTGGKASCPGVGTYFEGPPVRGKTQAAACTAAKHALNATVPEGCYPKHVRCICTTA